VVVAGLGTIGQSIIREIVADREHEVIGAVDPALSDRKLSRLCGVDRPIFSSLAEIEEPKDVRWRVFIQTTVSQLSKALPQILDAASRGWNVLSVCEELAFPGLADPRAARRLQEAAEKNGVAIAAVGVNPGFVLDHFILTLAKAIRRVSSVEAIRVVDVAHRRPQLQKKAGVGLTANAFKEGIRTGRVGHIGLKESAAVVVRGLGWRLEKLQETIRPVLDPESGRVSGVRHVASVTNGPRRLRLTLELVKGAPNPRDEITIEGEPPIRIEIPGGVAGEPATIARVVNSIPHLVELRPGLYLPDRF
jgi:4-hydroxy-tetrahydrodipicolinate reductase